MKILIRLPNWLGDVVMSTAFVNAAMEFYPRAVIDVIIKKELRDIAALIPGINQIHPFSKQEYQGISGAYSFGKQLRLEKYDIFFNLPESASSQILARATRAKHRVGFGGEAGALLLTNSYKKPTNSHRVDEYLSLLEQFTGKNILNRKVALDVTDVNRERSKGIVVNFNSEASSRRMPLEKARSILKLLAETFIDTQLIFIGSKKEAEFIGQVIEGLGENANIVNLAGKTDLPGLARQFAASAVVLTTDSGPAHLANAVGTPTIVLFGAGNEQNTAPYNKENLTVIRYGKLPCEPCVKNVCKLYGIPKCMEMLDGMAIISAIKGYLA